MAAAQQVKKWLRLDTWHSESRAWRSQRHKKTAQGGREIIDTISELLVPIKANEITTGGRAADVAPLNDEGVPVMSLKVDGTKYFWYHHTNADTFDKIDLNELNHCVATLAVMAYVIADMDVNFPRWYFK